MLKNIGQLFLGGLLLCFFITTNAKAASYELTLAQAYELALEGNLHFRLASLDWDAAQASLERAQIVGEEEMLAEAEKEWAAANKSYEEEKRNLFNLVRNAYRQVLEEETAAENRQGALERAKEQLQIDESKFAAGLLSSLDIQRTQDSLFNAQHAQEMAQINLATKRMELNQILGLDLQTKVILTEEPPFIFLPFPLGLEECYDLALEMDEGVLQALEALKKAESEVKAARGPFTPLVELEKALAGQAGAQLRLEKAKQALYFEIRADYYKLKSLAHTVEAQKRAREFEKKILQAEESKYKAGVISNAQIVAQQETLAQAEQDYLDALVQYSLSRNNLLLKVGRGQDQWGAGDDN